jgi:hypothetical protein
MRVMASIVDALAGKQIDLWARFGTSCSDLVRDAGVVLPEIGTHHFNRSWIHDTSATPARALRRWDNVTASSASRSELSSANRRPSLGHVAALRVGGRTRATYLSPAKGCRCGQTKQRRNTPKGVVIAPGQ